MTQYFACLLFESDVDDESAISSLTEESIRLIVADDEEAARKKAEVLGRESEHQYLNEEGSTVSWRFLRVVDVQEFCQANIVDGVEVYSRLIRSGRTES